MKSTVKSSKLDAKGNKSMPKLIRKSTFVQNLEISPTALQKCFTPRTMMNNVRTSETFSSS